MAEPKTKPTDVNIDDYIDALPDETKRDDSRALVKMMRRATGAKPVLWGGSIIGFGRYRYHYESGRTGEWPLVGFSPRKTNMTLYIMPGFESDAALLAKLGKHTTGKACLYVKRLADLDGKALEELIRKSVARMRETYEEVKE